MISRTLQRSARETPKNKLTGAFLPYRNCCQIKASRIPVEAPQFRRPFGTRIFAFFAILVFILEAGVNCGASGRSKEGEIRFEKREFALEKTGGELIPIVAELARTDTERARGLMNRPSLAGGEGMLFVFEREQILSFWMKDTLIPLSIAFIRTDGRITEIRDMKALDITPIVSARSARYALEVPQGWFTRAGIMPGDYLRLDGFY
ncbi:MAG: DUF192 domain-containing protein [Treponema sp.]|jgi:uncharacterized membrane protein (UPF0127 family)|nr:DUF192 domain-containing protein [Treponema sp.]